MPRDETGPPPTSRRAGPARTVIAVLVLISFLAGLGAAARLVLEARQDEREQEDAVARQRAAAARRRAQVELGAAIAGRDLDAVRAHLDDVDVAEPDDSLTVGEDLAVDLGPGGYAILTVELDAATPYAVRTEPALRAVLVDARGDAVVATGAVLPATDGAHLLLVADPRHRSGSATVGIVPVEMRPLALGEVARGQVATAGATIDFLVPGLEEGQQHIVHLSIDGLDTIVLAPDGTGVLTAEDPGNDGERFTAAAAGTYRVRVTAEAEATFDIEVWQLAEYNWYFGLDGDADRVEPTDDFTFGEWSDDGRNELQACLFLRGGVEMTFRVSARGSDNNEPYFALLDYALDDGAGRIAEDTQLRQRLRAPSPGGEVVWTTQEDQDRNMCLRVWVEGNPFPWTATASWEFTS